MSPSSEDRCRHLHVILGDQLAREDARWDGFDADVDAIWMAEAAGEAEHVWSSKSRIALFLSAMRHFRDDQRRAGRTVRYRALDEADAPDNLADALADELRQRRPEKVVLVRPGAYRLLQAVREVCREAQVELDLREDAHFITTPEDFDDHAAGRKQLRMEYFYREVRRRLDVLMDGRKPAGGTWNYDARNREPLPRQGPESIPQPAVSAPDKITREVIELVNERFADHPGRCDAFDWPVTPEKAREALDDFIGHRLAGFGPYQDAMWTGQPLLYHSRLSSAMNLHLLDPRDVVAAAERAYDSGVAPINSVEGFIRQVIGWREYVRGVYWRLMPDYLDRNALAAHAPLPAFYWTGETDLHCVACCVGQTLDRGYAHHIQRLMVTGLLALLADVDPVEVHKWYLAVYVDAVEWVELPNTLGMSQFADDGIMASKPYAASGKYIDRMSNYCRDCRYDPSERTGESACPFTTLYWDFLLRHRQKLSSLPRMGFQLKNADRIAPADARAIRGQAHQVKSRLTGT